MANAKVSASDVFFGVAAPPGHSFRNKIIGFITPAGDRNCYRSFATCDRYHGASGREI